MIKTLFDFTPDKRLIGLTLAGYMNQPKVMQIPALIKFQRLQDHAKEMHKDRVNTIKAKAAKLGVELVTDFSTSGDPIVSWVRAANKHQPAAIVVCQSLQQLEMQLDYTTLCVRWPEYVEAVNKHMELFGDADKA